MSIRPSGPVLPHLADFAQFTSGETFLKAPIVTPITVSLDSWIQHSSLSTPNLSWIVNVLKSIQELFNKSEAALATRAEKWFVEGNHPEYWGNHYNPNWSGSYTRQAPVSQEAPEEQPSEAPVDPLPAQAAGADGDLNSASASELPPPIVIADRESLPDHAELSRKPGILLDFLMKSATPARDLAEYLISHDLFGLEMNGLQRIAYRAFIRSIPSRLIHKKIDPLERALLIFTAKHLIDIQDLSPEEKLFFQTPIETKGASKNIAHLAAEQGCLHLIWWIETQGLGIQLVQKTTSAVSVNIAQIAAEKGDLELLKWIATKPIYSNLLIYIDLKSHRNIAHHAAMGGNVNILSWIQTIPRLRYLLYCTLSDGTNIAHIAATIGDLETFKWIATQPELKKLLSQGVTVQRNSNSPEIISIDQIASINGHQHIVDWIRENLPDLNS